MLFFLEENLGFDGVAIKGSSSASDGSVATSGSTGWDADGATRVVAGYVAKDGAAGAEVSAVAKVVGTGGSEASLGLIRLSMMRAK